MGVLNGVRRFPQHLKLGGAVNYEGGGAFL
jgi:hypothetical protein